MTTDPKSGAPAQPRKSRRRLWIGLGVAGGVIGLVVALAPTIAGSVAPSIVEKAAGKSISGTVRVASASFSWFGGQRVGPVELLGVDGQRIALVDLKVDKGALGLGLGYLAGGLDLGSIDLTGKAVLIRGVDGQTNLEKALAPRPGTPTTPPVGGTAGPVPATTLPAGLNFTLNARDLAVTFVDESVSPKAQLELTGLSAFARVGVGQALKVEASAQAITVPGEKAGNRPDVLSLRLTLDSWSKADGALTLDSATTDSAVIITQLPTAIVDAFLPKGLRETMVGPGGTGLPAVLGDQVDVTARAKGSLADLGGELHVAAGSRLSVDAKARYKGGAILSDGPILVRASGKAIEAVEPRVRELIAGRGEIALNAAPDVEVAIDGLLIPKSATETPRDLRTLQGEVAVRVSPIAGMVRVDDKQSAFGVGEATIRATTRDLAQAVTLTAKADASFDGSSAGKIDVDLAAGGLLDKAGALTGGMPQSVAGRASIKGVATAIAQAFVKGLPVDLAQDVGPTIDVELLANAPKADGAQGAIPATDLDLTLSARHARIESRLKLDGERLTLRGEPTMASLARAGAIAGRFVTKDSGYALAAPSGGAATVVVDALDVPLREGKPVLNDASLGLRAEVGGLIARNIASGAGADTLTVDSAALTLALKPKADPLVTFQARLTERTPFEARGEFQIADLIAASPEGKAGAPIALTPLKAKPIGRVEAKSVPTSLAGFFVPARAGEGRKAGMDFGALLGEVLGPDVGVEVVTTRAGEAIRAVALARSVTSRTDVVVEASPDRIDVKQMECRVSPEPGRIAAIRRLLGQETTGPRPATVVNAVIIAAPVGIPAKDYAPNLEALGRVAADVLLQGDTMVEGLTTTNEDGSTRALDPVGLRDLKATIAVDEAGKQLGSAGGMSPARVLVAGDVLGAKREKVGAIRADVGGALLAFAPAGAWSVDATLDGVDLAWADTLVGKAGKPGVLSSTLGERLTLAVKARASGEAGKALDFAKAPLSAEIDARAPRLTTSGPIKLSLDAGAIRLLSPATIEASLTPEFLNEAMKPDPAAPRATKAARDAKEPTRFTKPLAARVEIGRLILARPGDSPKVGPLKPGVFGMDVRVAIPEAALLLEGDKPAVLTGIEIAAGGGGEPSGDKSSVPFSLNIAQAVVGDQPPARSLAVTGAIVGIGNAAGEVDMDRAYVKTAGDLKNIPTGLVDALAHQNGTLVELLGPTFNADLGANAIPLSALMGKATKDTGLGDAPVSFAVNAARASTNLKGVLRPVPASAGVAGDTLFVSTEPITLKLSEITPTLGAKLVEPLPLIGQFEKQATDRPATITIDGLVYSLAGDLSRLSGEVRIDPGEARFGASGIFANLLEAGKIRAAGQVGRRLDPIAISIKNGVVSYPVYKLPLGEFTVEAEGSVDIAKRSIDVVTWLPFGALTDEAAGRIKANTGVGAALGRILQLESLTMVPFRTRGSMDNPKTEPDFELMLKRLPGKLDPRDAPDKVIDLLKDIIPKKKKEEPKPEPAPKP